MFKNLEKLAIGLGFESISLEFLMACQAEPGSFSRKASLAGLDIDVGIAAKREFFQFMAQGAQMFAKA